MRADRDSEQDNSASEVWRLTPTLRALLARGIDSATAKALEKENWTTLKLARLPVVELEKLGIPQIAIKNLRTQRRPPIPADDLNQVLFANRFICCVCRDPAKAIIIHHIEAWAECHDHSPGNLSVLCLEHHDSAHKTGGLSKNLDKKTLRIFKKKWEELVRSFDAKAIFDASQTCSDAWWYFNHRRLFELFENSDLSFKDLPQYQAALQEGLIEDNGYIKPRSHALDYMYEGGDGMLLYAYVRSVISNVIDKIPLINISDRLDRGQLKSNLKIGNILYVQGAHQFKALNKSKSDHRQKCRGTRKANHVKVTYVFDRWEATSSSAWGAHLSGRKCAGSLVRITSIESNKLLLEIEGTVLGICAELSGLKTRSYGQFSSGFQTLDLGSDNSEENWQPIMSGSRRR